MKTFEQWLKELDELFIAEYGLTHDHFPDWHWHDAFEDGGLNPQEAFDCYVEEVLL